MLFKKSLKKLTSVAVAIAIFGGMTMSDVEAANKAVNIPSKSAFKHTSIIGNNRADTSNIIISNSKETNNFILVNQYSGLSYALMNSANAAKTGSYIVPVNDGSIPKEHQYFSASDESVMNLKLSGNSSSFKGSFINDLSGTYANVEKNISNNLSRASVDNLNNNFSSASTVFIVNGDKGLADAMSIAPVSYRDKTPILFTTKDGNKIDGYSKKSGVNYVVVGGNKVVSDSLAKEYNATRLAGDTRYETNKAVLDRYYPNRDVAYFTNGDTLVDALSSVHMTKYDGIVPGDTRYETNKAVLDRYYPNRDVAYFTNGDTLVDALSSVHMTKDDGIVLVNNKKNHNLISNIDTYQIGGVEGYEFKYKNENGKFAGVSKVSAKKKTPVNNAATRYKVYQHKINIENVTGSHVSYPNDDMKTVINAILNGEDIVNLGVEGYEFKYKNENGKFAGVSKVSAKKKTPVNNAATRYKVYQHKINIENVTGSHVSYPNDDMKTVINAILNGEDIVNLSIERFDRAHGILCSGKAYPEIGYYDIENGSKTYIANPDPEYAGKLTRYRNEIKNAHGILCSGKAYPEIGYYDIENGSKTYIANPDPEYAGKLTRYRNEIKNALSSMNLYCSNDDMIRQINEYICNTYSYKVINGSSFDMINNYEGQCMHYAFLFNNMCAAVGIDMDYVTGDAVNGYHAWNRGTFDGKIYYFDITWNDPLGTDTFREDYLWLEKNPHLNIINVQDDDYTMFED